MSLSFALSCAAALCGLIWGLAVLLRRSRQGSDYAFGIGMILLSVAATWQAVLASDVNVSAAVRTFHLYTSSLIPSTWLIFSVTYARGNRAESLRKWRWIIIAAFVAPTALMTLFPKELVLDDTASSQTFRLGWAGSASFLIQLLISVAILMNLERTFRASVGILRWRVKFMLLGVGVLFVTRLYTASQVLLFGAFDPTLEDLHSGALIVASVLIFRSSLRAGRFTLDVYPSQSILQGSVTVLLAGIYLLVVGVFAKVVGYLGGDTSFALKAFVVLLSLVLLAILLQSDRAKLGLRRFVSRNFERPLYDYRTVWRRFTEGTASRVEQADLCRTLARFIAEMFQALSVSIWLIDPKQHQILLGASTAVSDARLREDGPTQEESESVSLALAKLTEPVDIESNEAAWATALRRWHPSQFPKGGNRVCLPLITRGEVLGLIILGDRVAGAAFSTQDFDMLRCVGDHAAANLYNVQLSHKLLQARELEAFQTMATFFVHDLKNAASTLKLMLQNLPVHFDDPEFRKDALRGTSKTVAHIDHLIGRLSSLRHELKTDCSPTDVNELVSKVISGLESAAGVKLETRLGQLPLAEIDSDQVSKVITNLVLNAVEASPPNSPVIVGTECRSGWISVSVSDSGSGMSPEFIDRSLYKPFQTTKKNGLGIGMFQSKAIIEAHRGRISLTSEVNKGTRFEISLPVSKV